MSMHPHTIARAVRGARPAWQVRGGPPARHPGGMDTRAPGGGRRTLSRGVAIGWGRPCFDAAAERLMTWQVHRDAGLGVTSDDARALPGTRVRLRIRLGPLVVHAPCEVIGVVAEHDEQGFTYATLPGHPEDGVEHFRITMDVDGGVHGSVYAESTAASPLARAGGPLTRAVQSWQTDRYLRAMRRGL